MLSLHHEGRHRYQCVDIRIDRQEILRRQRNISNGADGQNLPQMGEALFREYESVMKRQKIQESTPLTSKELTELFEAFLSVCRGNDIYYSWRPNLKDENDNFLIELAVASGAEVIVTYNLKDFENGQLLFSHRILSPENLIKELSS